MAIRTSTFGRGVRALPSLVVLMASLTVAAAPPASAAEPATSSRIAGDSRFTTAVAISGFQFPNGAPVAYLARADVPADALAAGALRDGPVLLVPTCGTLPAPVAAELSRLAVAEVVALGGSGAVCDRLLAEAAAGRTSARLAGNSRYETAAAISRRAFPEGSDEAYVASGLNSSPDAVAGGSLTRGPVLLLPAGTSVPESVTAEIARLTPDKVIALGGNAAVSDASLDAAAQGRPVDRYAGASRYATAVAISRAAFPGGAARVFLARGDVFADAVAGGSLTGGPVLLVPPCGDLPAAVGSELRRLSAKSVYALGGRTAVCDAVLSAAADPRLPRPDGAETGRVAFQHPTWGPSTLVTTVLEPVNSGGWIYVVDAAGDVRWSYRVTDAATLQPHAPGVDALGHLFLDFNPGRYNGVIVLRPVYDGFIDFATLPPAGEYNTRFYYAEAADADGDGRLEVVASTNDCDPDCAGGTVRERTFTWDGADYTRGSGLDETCDEGAVNEGVCRFVAAVQSGDNSLLSQQERELAATVTDLPSRTWYIAGCELVGDVSAECQVTFDATATAPEPTSAGFQLGPVNGEYRDGEIILPPGEELRYEVSEYVGLG